MLAVVPARGGSKTIRKKNLRTVAGKPLILHTLEMLAQVPEITRVVVSTEDPEIAGFCRTRGHEVIDRPQDIAQDDTPVAQVAQHATKTVGWTGPVGLFQPTSPTLKRGTVSTAIRFLLSSSAASVCSVTPDTKLRWDHTGPLFTERVNRQGAEPTFTETGGFFLARSCPIGPNDPLIGVPHRTFVVNEDEAVDIDTPADLAHAEAVLGRKYVGWDIVHGPAVGSGHLRRALALQDELDHDHHWGPSGDLVVFDRLDTTVAQVATAKLSGAKVVCLEDLGPGSKYADLVINELYADARPGVLSGPKYAVLRPEFLCLPEYEVRETKSVMVSFGGTDPAGLTERLAPVIGMEAQPNIVRPGDGTHMAEAMRAADLLVCSAGRTAHEAAAVGVPTITIAANEREARHSHCDGIVRLGLHATISDDQVRQSVARVLGNPRLRLEMSQTSRAQVDGLGSRRIAWHIESLLEGL